MNDGMDEEEFPDLMVGEEVEPDVDFDLDSFEEEGEG